MIIIILGRAVQFLLALVMMRVATTLLSPEEMGRVSLILTTIAFFALFLVNPVGMFINRRLHAWQNSGVARYYLTRYVLYLLLVAAFAAMVLFFLSMGGAANFGISITWLILLVSGSLLFNTINQTAIPSLNLLGDSRRFVLLTLATLVASFVFAIILVHLGKPSAQYWLLGLLSGQILLGIIGTHVFFSRLCEPDHFHAHPVIRRQHLRVLFNFAWPVAIAAGLGWVQGQGYRYILESQLGLAQLGLFVAGYGISAGVIAGFESVVTTYFQPRLYRDANKDYPNEQAAAWQRYASAVIPSVILTTVLIMLLAPELTRLFLGEKFQSASSFVIWGALAEAARVLAGVYSLIAHVFMRTRWLVLPTAAGAIFAITACLLLIPQFGAIGAGIGLALAGFVVVALLHVSLAPHVGGGIAIRELSKALATAVILWFIVLVLHALLGNGGWMTIASVIGSAGAAYLGSLYWASAPTFG